MNDRDDYLGLARDSQLLALAPGVPLTYEVEAMAAKARRLAASRARGNSRPLQLALAASIAMAAIALAVWLTPNGGAFARDRALAALLPSPDKVLVFTVEVSSSDPDVGKSTETTWVNASAGEWRTETRDSNGELTGIRVAIGGKSLWTEASADVLVEEPVPLSAEAAFPVWLVTLRDLIATPDKRVEVSRVTSDDEGYWRLKNDRSYDDLAPFEATLAVDDYRPERVTIGAQGEAGNDSATWTVTEWKSIQPHSLASDFFSFDQVLRLKPEGTPIQSVE